MKFFSKESLAGKTADYQYDAKNRHFSYDLYVFHVFCISASFVNVAYDVLRTLERVKLAQVVQLKSFDQAQSVTVLIKIVCCGSHRSPIGLLDECAVIAFCKWVLMIYMIVAPPHPRDPPMYRRRWLIAVAFRWLFSASLSELPGGLVRQSLQYLWSSDLKLPFRRCSSQLIANSTIRYTEDLRNLGGISPYFADHDSQAHLCKFLAKKVLGII